MANRTQKIFINANEPAFSLENTASLLDASPATVRNWVKRGLINRLGDRRKNFFRAEEIKSIKSEMMNGDLGKLNKRANKSMAERVFMPEEYLNSKCSFNNLLEVIDFIKNNKIGLNLALLFIAINLLQRENILSKVSLENMEMDGGFQSSRRQIEEELKSWFSIVEKSKIKKEYSFLLDCPLPKNQDVLGFIYQSLLLEGKKSQCGSYYTPLKIVNEIVDNYVKKDSKSLDPCCGTGQFLLAFADIIEDPENIYGIDIDEIAVRIARINLLVKYKNKDFTPNVICKDTLFDIDNRDLFSLDDGSIRDFDVIATNPPWGFHFSRQDLERLKKTYSRIASFESFSYFLYKSVGLLKADGILSFILPQAVLNVKTHKDIRSYILDNLRVKKIIYLDRVFKNVFTPAIRIDLIKGQKLSDVEIHNGNENYRIAQDKWKNNRDLIFDIYANKFDSRIIDDIYHVQHATLKNQAEWALGIVTGGNAGFISSDPKKGYEEVYKGKDVEKFVLKNPSSYILFIPDRFQQIAPEEKYRAKEKLIYKFISRNLVFAYDDRQRLTLNSANILIPKLSDYPMKVIAALFNSSLYQFIFKKKFSSIKVLRSHIEQLPLPLWDQVAFNDIVQLVDGVIGGKVEFEELDDYIMSKYFISKKKKNYIRRLGK